MPELKPVAEIVQREPFDDGSPNPCKAILWEGNNAEDDFLVGTKLYAIPADQVLVSRELLSSHIKQLDDWNSAVEKIIGKPVGYLWESLEQLRAILHP